MTNPAWIKKFRKEFPELLEIIPGDGPYFIHIGDRCVFVRFCGGDIINFIKSLLSTELQAVLGEEKRGFTVRWNGWSNEYNNGWNAKYRKIKLKAKERGIL